MGCCSMWLEISGRGTISKTTGCGGAYSHRLAVGENGLELPPPPLHLLVVRTMASSQKMPDGTCQGRPSQNDYRFPYPLRAYFVHHHPIGVAHIQQENCYHFHFRYSHTHTQMGGVTPLFAQRYCCLLGYNLKVGQ